MNTKKIKIKETKDLTINEFKIVYNILSNSNLSEIEKTIEILKFYTDLTESEVENLDVNAAKSIVDVVYKSIQDVLNQPTYGLPYKIKIRDKEFKVCQTFKEFKFGQFIDWQVLLYKLNQSKNQSKNQSIENLKNPNLDSKMDAVIINNLDSFMACFVHTKTDSKFEYKSFEVIDYVRDFKFLDAYRTSIFFLNLKPKLNQIFQHYLKKMTDKEIEMDQNIIKILKTLLV